MGKIKFSKDYISIQNIGLKRFWAGVAAGLFSSISLSLAFNYTREVYRLITSIEPDLLILDKQEYLFYDMFFASLSATLGFAIAVWIWMNNNNHLRKRDRINKQLARTYSLLGFWVFFGVVARFGTNLPIILYRTYGYDNHLNLHDDFWLIFVLIPIVVFFQSWLGVRLVYRPGKWIWLSLICCLTMSLVLFKTTGVDREIVNTNYFLRYETQLLYVESEVLNAQKEYGIKFDQKTISSLKKFSAESSLDQFESVRLAFRSGRKVNLDTIIMQKIILHNMKEGYWQYYWGRNDINNWRYPLPTEILKQIYFHGSGTPETGELFNILNLQIELANISLTSPEYRNNWSNLTLLEMQRVSYANFHLPEIIIEQLVSVLGELRSMPEYQPYIEKLDDLKYED
jgi:hypothetical protein